MGGGELGYLGKEKKKKKTRIYIHIHPIWSLDALYTSKRCEHVYGITNGGGKGGVARAVNGIG